MADDNKLCTAACVQGGKPPCTCACPLNFDIKPFLKKIQAGNFETSYRDYAGKVVFPAIVSRICDERCMADCPEKLSIRNLERATVEYVSNRAPQHYNLPARKGKIAIIGAGLSGLACAQKLAVKKYDVTIFEKTNKIGGTLSDVLSEEIYMDEINRQFDKIDHTLITNRDVQNLKELDFTAIYIATGAGGSDFGLLNDEWNPQSLATSENGVFLGGKITGGNHIDALAQGVLAAASIDRFMKISSMTGQPESFYEHECKLPKLMPAKTKPESIKPFNGEFYTKEEATDEAKRCIDCDCSICYNTCEFMKEQGFLPKRIEVEALAARTTQKGLVERIGTRMTVSCSLCGHCEAICEHNVSLEKLMRENKRRLFEEGVFAPPYHDFYMRDMASVMGDAYLAQPAPGYETATYLFFPGCQMTASDPDYVNLSYNYIRQIQPDTALLMACCGVPALYGGDMESMKAVQKKLVEEWERFGKPVLILGCATCAKTFREFLPDLPFISLYEFIFENGLPNDAAGVTGQWALFDPCSSRKFPEMQNAVRALAQKLGTDVEELPECKDRALCCGMGGHIYAANPNLARKVVHNAITQSEAPYITYCTNCRNLFLSAGKPVAHILDGIFGLKPLEKPIHIAKLHFNRLLLKKQLLKNIWNTEVEMPNMSEVRKLRLIISEDLYNKMDSLLISEDDIYAVIEHCEAENLAILNKETGTLSGHLTVGIITYWVEYRRGEQQIEVINAYSHRVLIS